MHEYINAWIPIEKTEQYKEYVIDFLRSYCSVIRSNRKFVTVNRYVCFEFIILDIL
jgi:hypothetical protein